jgi:hypothetical protein
MKIKLVLDLHQLGAREHLVIEVREWEPAAMYEPGQLSTEALHGKSPVRPYRANEQNPVCNVEKRMDGAGAGGQPIDLVLVVNSRHMLGQPGQEHVQMTYLSYSSTHQMNPARTSSTSARVIDSFRHLLMSLTNSMKWS